VLEAINTYQKNGEKSQELGVGIANCMERLSLIYQDRAKICCFNRTNPETEDVLGASVEITISLTEKESSDSLADGKGKERNE
jgi:hypothetical protein